MSEYRMEKKHFFLHPTLLPHNALINRKLHRGGVILNFGLTKIKGLFFLNICTYQKKVVTLQTFI